MEIEHIKIIYLHHRDPNDDDIVYKIPNSFVQEETKLPRFWYFHLFLNIHSVQSAISSKLD